MNNSNKDWIKNKLRENNYDKKEVIAMFSQFQDEMNNYNWSEESYCRYVRQCYSEMVSCEEIDVSEDLIKLEANKQKQTDKNNYLRKINRESFREYNLVEETYKNYVEILSKLDLSKVKFSEHKENKKDKSRIGVLQITDTHINTLLNENDSLGNCYDFNIASKRFKKLIDESIREFKLQNVNTVYFCMTGDLVSSSRRLQEVLSQNSSICMASIILTKFLVQSVIDLNKYFNVKITFCVGNESRVNQDLFSGNSVLSSENFDFIVYNNMKLILSEKKGVEFIDPKSLVKSLVKIPLPNNKEFNLVLTHGNQIKCNEKSYSVIANQFLNLGEKVDLIICGHYHHFANFEKISFCGSMIGQTEYSCGLGFTTRASQSIYIIEPNGTYWVKVIDLQTAENEYEKGYDYNKELEPFAYLVKQNGYNNTVTIKNLC